MQKYSTAECPDATSKIVRWRELCAEHFEDLEFSPLGEDAFDSELTCADVGALRLMHSRSMPAKVGRSKARVARQVSDVYYLHLQLEGSVVCAHHRGDAPLAPGDFVLCHSSEPYWFLIRAPARTLILCIPGGQLRAYIPAPERVLGHRFRGDDGVAALAGQFVVNLWNRSENLETAPEDIVARLGGNVLDVLATAVAQAGGVRLDESVGGGTRRAQIRRCIEENFRNPDFGVTDVASLVGISERYARKLFEAEDETICAQILRRRLEECAKQLRDPIRRGQSITDIAFAFGFNNSAYFATAFKARYRMTPSQFRASERLETPSCR
jgi:AraC-like DNA-binding protein